MASNYTYKYIIDEYGQIVYPRTALSAVDLVTANGIQVDHDTISVRFATKEQIRDGSQGQIVSADGLKEAIAAYSDALYIPGGGIGIQGGTIFAKPAPVKSLIDGTPNEYDAVTNANLNGAMEVGQAVEVTSMPPNMPYYNSNYQWSSITYYTEVTTTNGVQYTDNCIRLQIASPSTTYMCYGWDPLPGFINGHVYLITCDEKAVSGSIRANIGVNSSLADIEQILDPNGNIIRGNNKSGTANEPFLTSTWERLAVCIKAGTPNAGLWFYSVAGTAIDVRLKNFHVFDVTGLSMEMKYAIATAERPGLWDRYLVKNDAVCPWMPIHDLGARTIVSLEAGRAYKLTANDGNTHSITINPMPSNSYGKETYLTVLVGASSNIAVKQPLVLIDPLVANAANNCVIRFYDGYARMYVNDTDYGYIVTVTSGNSNGSLYYGLFNTTDNYILFSQATDRASCSVSTGNATIPSSSASTRTITGNGKAITEANFNNTQIKPAASLTFSDISIKNASVSSGAVYATDVSVGNITVAGGSLTLSGDITLTGNVTGSGTNINADSFVNGTGTIDKVNNTGFSNIDIDGVNVTRANTLYYTTGNHTVKNSTLTNFYYGTGAGICVAGGDVDIQNVTISGCSATGRCVLYVYGGVAHADSCIITGNSCYSSPVNSYQTGVLYIKNSTISNNHAYTDMGGLGPFVNGTMTVENCIVSDNWTDGTCGALICNSGAHLYVRNTLVTRNKANNNSGAFFSSSATTEMTGCTFSYNYSGGYGGGIFLTANAILTMDRCLVTGNTSANHGPGIYLEGNASVVVTNSTISNNNYAGDACRGTALCIHGTGTASLIDCVISGNTNPSASVFIYNGTCSATLTRCLITENISTRYDTIICAHMGGSVLTISGCTVSKNRSATSNIIVAGATATLNAYNCLVTGNTATTWGGAFASHHVNYTFVIDGCYVEKNVVGAGYTGRGGYFYGSGTRSVTIKDSTFMDDQDIDIASGVLVTISGSNVFKSGVTGSGSITFAANTIVDLKGNTISDAITGSTITTQGMLTVINKNGQICNHLAYATTSGSTITNMGVWLPSPTRLVIPANTTASFRGYDLSNNTVTAVGGGGINATAGNINADIYDTIISNNTGSYIGTGVYTTGSTDKVTLHNCIVNNCQIYPVYANYQSTINMYGTTVSNCYTTYDIVFAYSGSHINAFNCLITNNKTADYGDMAIGAHVNSECNITGCTVSYNWAQHCAGYHIAQTSYGTATNCLIKGNTATAGGGGAGMWVTGATMSLVRCTFEDNVAQYGAGVCCNNSNCYLNITDCIFNNGQDVYCYTSNCQVKLYGNNEFRALVSCTNGCITVAADAVINLRNNPVDNAVVGGTIAVLGSTLAVRDAAGGLHQYPARTITGSTITNRGAWLPTPRLYYNTANTVAELTGVILSDFTITSTSERAVDIQNSGTNSTITLNNIEINRNTLTTSAVGVLLNVYANGTKLIINGGTISENNATYAESQHLVYTATASTISLTGVLMENNKVSRSCVATNGSSAVIYINASTISNNYCTVADCALWAHSGSIYATNCLVTGNTTPQHDSPAVVAYTANSYISLTGCVITNNVSHSINSGVGAHTSARVDVVNCYISGNTSGTNGGGLLCDVNSTMTVSGSTVTGNTATYGSCAYIGENSTISFTGSNTLDGTIYFTASSGQVPKLNFSGNNNFKGTIVGNYTYALITISAGAVLDFYGNNNTNVILGGTVTAAGKFSIRDKNGRVHDYTARSVVGSTITNTGIWLPYSARIDLTGSVEHCGYSYSGLTAATSGSVIYASGTGTKLIKDINITGCTNSGTTVPANCGIITTYASGNTVSIVGCTVTNCRCGYGTLFVTDYSNTTIENCLIYNNVATGYGGAVQCYNYGYLTMKNCEMYGNSAGYGGTVMTNNGNTMNIMNCYIHDNAGSVPGLYQTSGSSVVTVTGCTFGAGQTIRSEGGSFTFSGTNVLQCLVQKTVGAIIIASGAVLNLRGNANTTAISGATITAQGSFTVIDTNGTSHSYSATSKTNSTITNAGVWS